MVDKMGEISEGSKVILEALRILILISQFEYRKSFKLTVDKIMLYDYYMKFPETMIETREDARNFHEYYAFYHWKPNYKHYINIIRFLLSKGLIEMTQYVEHKNCLVTDQADNLINSLDSSYKRTLLENAKYIRKNVANKSNKEVEEIILSKNKGEYDAE